MDYDEGPATGRSVRGRMSSNGKPILPSFQEQLAQLEADAYSAVLKAFGAQSEAITWAKERLMSELRKELSIGDELHRQLLDQVHADDTIHQICRWKKAQEMGGSFRPPSPVLEASPLPSSSSQQLQRKKQKTAALSVLPSPPLKYEPPAEAPAMAAAKPPPPPRRAPPGKKGKKGKGGRFQSSAARSAAAATASATSALPGGAPALVHPWIGRRVKTRWTNEDGSSQFYESVVSDYLPESGEHGLVYDIGTKDESWEWVDLSKIPKQDIIWVPGPPLPLLPKAPQGVPAGGLPIAPPHPLPPVAMPDAVPKLEAEFDLEEVLGSGEEIDLLAPLEGMLKLDKIEDEDNLETLQEAKRFIKVREAIVQKALHELEDDSVETVDDNEDDDEVKPTTSSPKQKSSEDPSEGGKVEILDEQGDEYNESPEQQAREGETKFTEDVDAGEGNNNRGAEEDDDEEDEDEDEEDEEEEA